MGRSESEENIISRPALGEDIDLSDFEPSKGSSSTRLLGYTFIVRIPHDMSKVMTARLTEWVRHFTTFGHGVGLPCIGYVSSGSRRMSSWLRLFMPRYE
jgi:hypothetical protein